MLKIAICDDNKGHRKEIKNIISHILFDRVELYIDMFADGKDIVTLLENDLYDFDLIFLDIKMPIIDGLETAKILREYDIDTDIIFFTAHSEYVYDAFIYKAFSFLTKPVSTSKLANELLRYIDEWENISSNFLFFTTNGYKQKIKLNKIRFIESSKRKVTVFIGNDSFEFYAKLDDIEADASKFLIRTHQSYLVNIKKISSIKRTEVVMENGQIIPLSKRYYEPVMKAFDI